MLIIGKRSHMDHGLTDGHVEWVLRRFARKNAFFAETVQLPANLPAVMSGIYGPIAGDLPVLEQEVHYTIRGSRHCATRVVNLPMRPTNMLTVIAGPGKDGPCVLYTAYGGPLAPREPGDTSIPSWEEVLEARDFWRVHALSVDV